MNDIMILINYGKYIKIIKGNTVHIKEKGRKLFKRLESFSSIEEHHRVLFNHKCRSGKFYQHP